MIQISYSMTKWSERFAIAIFKVSAVHKDIVLFWMWIL
jgi:hypothetical protein